MTRSQCAVAVLLCVGLILVGCVTTRYTLIPPEQAKVDRQYIGDYEAIDASGKHTTFLIRNLDDKQYYVEFAPADAEKPARYYGFISTIKDATFAQLKQIQEDGNVPAEWTLLRIDLAGGKLALRPLSEEFFKKQSIDSADALRKFIEANVDNHELYDHNAALVATKIG